jgi:hypothetical protein
MKKKVLNPTDWSQLGKEHARHESVLRKQLTVFRSVFDRC